MCYEFESFEKARIAERLRRSKEASQGPASKTESQVPAQQVEPERIEEQEPVPA